MTMQTLNQNRDADKTARRVYWDVLEIQRMLNRSRPQQERLVQEAKRNLRHEQWLERFINISWGIGEAALFTAVGVGLVKKMSDGMKAYLVIEKLGHAEKAAIMIKAAIDMSLLQVAYKHLVVGRFTTADGAELLIRSSVSAFVGFFLSPAAQTMSSLAASDAVRVALPLTYTILKNSVFDLKSASAQVDKDFADKNKLLQFSKQHGRIARMTDIDERKWEAIHLLAKYSIELKATQRAQTAVHAVQQSMIRLFESAPSGGTRLHLLIKELEKLKTLNYSPNEKQMAALVTQIRHRAGL
ncbi:MAG: hypothetical protein ACI9G1_002576 [Pirellulaceae bacterium]